MTHGEVRGEPLHHALPAPPAVAEQGCEITRCAPGTIQRGRWPMWEERRSSRYLKPMVEHEKIGYAVWYMLKMEQGGASMPASHVTIIFADIRGFTQWAEGSEIFPH